METLNVEALYAVALYATVIFFASRPAANRLMDAISRKM